MEDIVGLCKRRGFIFQSSEIYGGYNGFYDYGPLGVELRNNIKQAWWRDFVQCRDDMEGLDSTIIMHPKIWQASGFDPEKQRKLDGLLYLELASSCSIQGRMT